jgi:hypothetical protein
MLTDKVSYTYRRYHYEKKVTIAIVFLIKCAVFGTGLSSTASTSTTTTSYYHYY